MTTTVARLVSRKPSLPAVASILAPLLVSAAVDGGAISAILVLIAISMSVAVGPANATGAVAAALPLVSILTQVGGARWSLLELTLLCCLAACTGELAHRLVGGNGGFDVRPMVRPLDLTIVGAAIVLVGVTSLEFVADERAMSNSFRELRRVIVEPLIVVLAVRLSPREALLRLVAGSLAAGGLAVSAIALAQVGLRSSGVEVGAVFRPIGTYPHPNNLALYLERVAWLPLAVTSARIPARLAAAGTGVIAVACAATLSRGAVAALVVGGVAWLVLTGRRPRPASIVVIAMVAVGLVLIARTGGDSTESLDSRGRIWTAAVDMIRDYPVTGIGIDQFYAVYGTRYVDPAGWSERYTSHPHNLVLDVWLQLGIAGLAVFAALVVLVSRRFKANLSLRGDLASAALLAGLVGGLTHGLIDNGFFLPDLATFVWLTLAMTAVAPARELTG